MIFVKVKRVDVIKLSPLFFFPIGLALSQFESEYEANLE